MKRGTVFSPAADPWLLLTDASSSREIYSEDSLTAAAFTQSQCYIIHLFLRGYKLWLIIALSAVLKPREDHTFCQSEQ